MWLQVERMEPSAGESEAEGRGTCVYVCVREKQTMSVHGKSKRRGVMEGMEKRKAGKFQDPRSRGHQPSMADSREKTRGVQSKRGSPLDLERGLWHYFSGCNKPSILHSLS